MVTADSHKKMFGYEVYSKMDSACLEKGFVRFG